MWGNMRSKFEIMAQKELENEGWLVDWKIRPSGLRMPSGYQVDYWGVFDLLAYQGKMIRGIAIKGQGGVPSRLRKMVMDMEMCEHFVKEIWTYRQPTKNDKRLKYARYVIRKEIL